jgi:hypothetical protein
MADVISQDRFVRVFHAAYPHFSRLSEVLIANVRARYPKTSYSLVHLAASIANEEYGNALLNCYRQFSAEEKQLDFPSLVELLAIEARKLPPTEMPEILEQQVSKTTSHALLQLFEESMEKYINLSHLTVKMLLNEKMEEQATTVAIGLGQSLEQSKAFLELIKYKIQRNQVEAAADLYPRISSFQEKRLAAASLVDAWLHKGMVEEAIIFSGEIEEESERNHALQEASLCMAKQGHIDEAIALIDCFTDTDTKAYAFSRLVNNLATVGDFKNAVPIAYSIKEHNYREDAFIYILNKLISMRRIKEAIDIASLIPGIKERLAAAKRIERAMLSYQQDTKIKRLLPGIIQ